MATYKKFSDWDEFSKHLEELPNSSKKPKLAMYIDYFLWQGGTYREIKDQIERKAIEIGHKGYKGPERLFNPKGEPQQRSFLGHIATRVIDEDLIIEISGNPITASINEISINEKIEKNQFFFNLCEQDSFIRIEGFKGNRRKDKAEIYQLEDDENNVPNYLPTKEDCELAYNQISNADKDIDIDVLLDQIEKNIKSEGKKLKNNWRIETEDKIELWYGPNN